MSSIVPSVPANHLDLAVDIVRAYVANNTLPAGELPKLIASVHQALSNLGAPQLSEKPKPLPAISPKRSVTNDYIVCLEDGKKFKSLKRHLRTHYNMTPEQYRAKWDLPADYPMVAPSYSEKRSALAKDMGLGRPNKKAAPNLQAA